MLGNISHSASTETLTRNVGELYLGQARTEKANGHLDVALTLYDQLKETLKSLGSVKEALRKAQDPQTLADETLRAMMADAYFERGEVLEGLNLFAKARNSYFKAGTWGHTEAQHRVEASQSPASGHSGHSSRLVLLETIHEKSGLVDYLFEKALLTLSSLEVSNKPSLFLVYAHDNDAHGEAKASTSKYLINHLSKIRGVTLYSDQTPIGQAYSSSVENLKEDGKLEDILTNQLCLLPAQVRADVKPVDKVIVCCSDVLGSYLKGQSYKTFCDELKKAYDQDREAYVKDSQQKGTPALREVVRQFSQEEKYRAEFHHVLTEMAFLEIRAGHLKGQHGIIPVSLTLNSYDYCLKDFIDSTTVRMEDPLRFDLQAKKGEEVYLNQGSHGVLFKVIERLLAGSNEAKTFLDKFWDGHSHVISRLKSDSKFGKLEFAMLLDGIFDGIRTALHCQLASTVQQEHEQLQAFRVDPRVALQKQYDAALKQDRAFEETRQLYVEPRGKACLDGKTKTFELLPQVQEFLNDKQVILLTGDSGVGKTTFNRRLEKQLWNDKKGDDDAIPLFISLASIDKPEQDLIAKALKKRGLSEFQIQTLKKEKQKFVFILDGYDEIRQTPNLYLSNRINLSDDWQGRMVISCRSEYLCQDYQSHFQPNPHLLGEDSSFQEVVIEPFSEEECNQYLEKYVEYNPKGWAVQQYQKDLAQDHLQVLVSNPFLLRVVLEALPDLENAGKERSAVQLRMDLYDQFVRQLFERNEQRLREQDLTGTKSEVFKELCDDGFAQHGVRFVKDLAVHFYTENAGKPVVDYSLFKDEGSWKDAFFGREDKKQLLRDGWPLSRNGNQYRFIHKSLFEYFVARSLFDSFDECMVPAIGHRRGSDASIYSFENQTVLPRRPLRDISLTPKHWVSDLGVVQLLTERVKQEETFKEQLKTIIERSKIDAGVRQAAANAITILVKAGVQFNGVDFKGIQIPGADLSHGEFDSVQLQEADLRKVHLRTIWLRNANLSGAQMNGVKFGELPFLQEEKEVKDCTYSLDGKNCAVGLENGTISVYDASNWERIHTLRGHTHSVNRVTYSPSGQQLASASEDTKVCLWDAHSGQQQHILNGHTHAVKSVMYSPNGQQIASCSEDTTVRLWDAQSGQLRHSLSDVHTGIVWSVTYSPNGQQIASGSEDTKVCLWDTRSGQLRHIFRDHTHAIWSVRYSPNGQQIVSCSEDTTVCLWDAQSGQRLHHLRRHTGTVRSVRYSPSGRQIASCSEDNTVRLWDAQSGQLRYILRGHAGTVLNVTYSPNGQQIASCSEDNTVRLWDAQSGRLSRTLSGHTHSVRSVTYSPNGQQIASGSWDTTVRLWDAQSGQPSPTLSGHTGTVLSVTYSPDGQQIASYSEDHTVRLWDAQSGQPSHTLGGHTGTVRSVRYSPRGQQIVSCSEDTTVRQWDVQSGQLRHILSGHTGIVLSVKYSPSGQEIASGSEDTMVRLWDAQSGQLRHILKGHGYAVRSVMYSSNGRQIASCSDDTTVRLWDTQSGQLSHTLSDHKHAVLSVRYSPDGHQIASCSRDTTVCLWDTQTGQLCHTLKGHTGTVWSVTYSPNGHQIASCSRDTTVRLWDTQSGQPHHILKGHERSVLRVRYSPKGQQIVSCGDDTTVRLWDAQSGQLSHTLSDHTGTVLSVTYSPSGQQIASCSRDTTVRLWDVQLSQSSQTLSGRHAVLSVTYSPSGEQIASCSDDNTVRLWDAQLGQLGQTLSGHTGTVNSVVYSPSGGQLASGSMDNTVRLWEAESGALVHTLKGHTNWVNSVVYSPSVGQLASGSYDRTVRLWEAESGAAARTLEGHTGAVYSVVYSPSGGQLASGSYDNTVRLWEAESGALMHSLEGHTGAVYSVVYSPSGGQLASGGYDNTVRLWEAESGALVHTLEGHTGAVCSVVYSPSGGQLASGSSDKTVRLWDVALGQCRAVIEGFDGGVNSAAWKTSPDIIYLVTGSRDGLVRQWQVIEEGDEIQVCLRWISPHGELSVKDTLVKGVRGLSVMNEALLKQRGAKFS